MMPLKVGIFQKNIRMQTYVLLLIRELREKKTVRDV